MELNATQIDIKKSGLLATGDTLQHGFIEKLLITLVASLGLLGSVFIISNSAAGAQPPLPEGQVMSYSAAVGESLTQAEDRSNDLDDYIRMEGKKRVGNPIYFEFLRDELPADHRYMLDMGDGMRVMLTQSAFDYAYKEKGRYTIDLLGVKNAVVTKIASKRIRIR